MTDIQADKLIERINQDMRQAIKNREHTKCNALKSLLARISSAEAIAPQDTVTTVSSPIAGAVKGVGSTDVPRKQLTLAETHSIIHAELQEIQAVLAGLDETSEYATELHEKAAAVQKYM